MSKWAEYENFSKLAKTFGGPKNFITLIVTGSVTIGSLIAIPITKHFTKKKLIKEKEEKKLISLEDYKHGEVNIKQGDIVTVGYVDDGIALIKINDLDDAYYVSLEELLKITKKVEDK